MEQSSHDVTRLLQDWCEGDEGAAARLMPLVYEELRRLARHYLRRERPDLTLQPTALVNEAYLKLVDQRRVKLNLVAEHAAPYASNWQGPITMI